MIQKELYESACFELNNLLEDLRYNKDLLFEFKQNHTKIEYENRCESIQKMIHDVHIKFIELCANILNLVYAQHEFELATEQNFDIITNESKIMLQELVCTYKNDINPLEIKELMYDSLNYEDRDKIFYCNKYLTFNCQTYQVELHPQYMTKYILELFGLI